MNANIRRAQPKKCVTVPFLGERVPVPEGHGATKKPAPGGAGFAVAAAGSQTAGETRFFNASNFASC